MLKNDPLVGINQPTYQLKYMAIPIIGTYNNY